MNNRKGFTPEQIEYEDAAKRMRTITAKMRIAQEGVDTSSISQQKLDSIMRTFDDMDQIHRDVQQKKSKIQQDANASMQQVDQDANKKFIVIQKRYQDTIKSLKEMKIQDDQIKKDGDVIEEDVRNEEVRISEENIEEVREKTHEEKVSEMTDILLKLMRKSVSKKVDEILRTVEQKAEFTVGKGDVPEIIEELTDHTKQTTVESAMVEDIRVGDDKQDNT